MSLIPSLSLGKYKINTRCNAVGAPSWPDKKPAWTQPGQCMEHNLEASVTMTLATAVQRPLQNAFVQTGVSVCNVNVVEGNPASRRVGVHLSTCPKCRLIMYENIVVFSCMMPFRSARTLSISTMLCYRSGEEIVLQSN